VAKKTEPHAFALTPQRRFCYSRNLFAQQKSQHDGSPLRKGYAITSEHFHVMKIDDQLKMFLWKADPTNHFDILPLIKYKKSGEAYLDLEKAHRQRTGGIHPHMQHFFSAEMVPLIAQNLHDMKTQLDTWIKNKSQAHPAK
jgi:hypothetical protein